MTAWLEGESKESRAMKKKQLEVIKVLRGFLLSSSREVTFDIKFFFSSSANNSKAGIHTVICNPHCTATESNTAGALQFN